jgi:hypothetical protein
MNVLHIATASTLTLGLSFALPACNSAPPEPQRASESRLESDTDSVDGDPHEEDDDADREGPNDSVVSPTNDPTSIEDGNVAGEDPEGWGDCARAIVVCGSCIRWRGRRPSGWDPKCIQQRGPACIEAAIACGITISDHL